MGGRVLRVAAALLLLSGCGSSPPTRFYTLSDTPASGGTAAGVGQVVVGSVSIPGEIDRPEIVRKVAPNQLSVAGSDRWAAPLEDIIRRVLIDDIAQRAPGPAAEQQRLVSVDIHEFYGDAGCNVTLRAVWTLKQAGENPERQWRDAGQPASEEIRVPSTGACPATLPGTMSIALGQLSDRIITGVAHVAPAAAKK